MKLFIASSLCWHYHPKDVIKIAALYGFQGVEMWAEHMYDHDAHPEAVRDCAEQANLTLSLHASSWDLNICSINEGVQEQSLNELYKSIDLASRVNARHMTFHPGKYSVKTFFPEAHEQALISNTQKLMAYASEKDVTLSMELMEPLPKEILTTPDKMAEFKQKLRGGLHVTLDIAHVPLVDDALDYLEQITDVNSIHLSDSSAEHYHLPLGEGSIDLGRIQQRLAESGLPVVLEGLDTSEALPFLRKHIQFLQREKWLEGGEHD
ncbi:sugar phosphate isomerase/epimerase [Lentibacillus sp. CBA3610]|uniref:sugar phosphate isomerase/epimerase family protein n=1 Tax=Lentibacillus sp. CBA3610 TaxID=2518176 RepID=UPI0015955BBC|nr:sugar phosphate isomerase/epimerase family protein [Lentibacillus sp. CBA3610]QKY69336.1 sugar phosphate isomerase/epimerase [Lentibacillus sp. CBA3610]